MTYRSATARPPAEAPAKGLPVDSISMLCMALSRCTGVLGAGVCLSRVCVAWEGPVVCKIQKWNTSQSLLQTMNCNEFLFFVTRQLGQKTSSS